MQLDELVRTALTERRGLLEQIVRREVEAVVSELVDAQLNGNTSTEMVLSRAALPQEATEQTGQGSGSTQTLADRKRLVSAARTFASTPAGAPVEPAAAGSSANVKLAPPGRHQTAARSLTRRRHRSEDAEASVASSPTASGPSAAAR